MFYKVQAVTALPDLKLRVQFVEGACKIYDVKPLFSKWNVFERLQTQPGLFEQVRVAAGGYGVIWNDDIDLSCNELWYNGVEERKK